jgi:hypothetical protein
MKNTSTTRSALTTLSQILTDLNYRGNATYLPPHYFTNAEPRVYIPQVPHDDFPTREDLQHQENATFLTNPDAALIIPPGLALSQLVEDKAGSRFPKMSLEQLQHVLPKVFLEDLEIAEKFEIQINPSEDNTNPESTVSLPLTTNESIRVIITRSIYEDFYKAVPSPIGPSICKIGCPLCSAIACILTKTLRKPITIENISISDDATTIETTYQAHETEERLELVEGEQIIPHIFRRPSLAGLLLTTSGAFVLAWVGWLIWYDGTIWNKDLVQIFFGSRTGEAMSLGLGVQAIHYLLVGVALLLLGVITVRPNIVSAIHDKLTALRTSII